MLDIVSFILGLGIGLAVAVAVYFVLVRGRAQQSDHFKALSQDILQANNEAFLTLAQQKLSQHQEGAEAKLEKKETAIKTLVEPVNKHLDQLQQRLQDMGKDHAGLKQQIQGVNELQAHLRNETRQLSEALRNPRSRGEWGEQHLQVTLEHAGMVENRDFELQHTVKGDEGERLRPDVVIKLSGGRCIVIDSKVPLENFLDAQGDSVDAETRSRLLSGHAQSVRNHINDLKKKSYWDQFEGPEFVVMFLPSEGIFHAALKEDPDLLDYSAKSNILIVSPYTLMALLKTIAFDHKQEKLAEHAQEISQLGHEIYKSLATFGKHMSNVGTGIDKAREHYNKAISSLESRVLSKARKFEELSAAPEGTDMPQVEQLDELPKQLSAPEFSEGEDKTRKAS